jgi:parallel beta-helix repeat protein
MAAASFCTNYSEQALEHQQLLEVAVPPAPPDPFTAPCTAVTDSTQVWPGMSSVSPANPDLVAFAGQAPNLAQTYDQNWNQIAGSVDAGRRPRVDCSPPARHGAASRSHPWSQEGEPPMLKRILAASMAILMTAAGAPAWAADCGDTSGPGGVRVACGCGDSVTTNTVLRSSDPVVTALCTDIGLLIGLDNVTLNCHGNELTGEPNNDGIVLEDRTGVTVRNCKITGFLDGIQLIRSSGNALITNTIADSANNGIDFEDDNHDNLVKGNRVVAAGNDAINVDGVATGNTFLTNTLEGAGVSEEDGIDLDGPGATHNTVRGNRISGFSDSGIEVGEESGENLITENRAEGNCTGILVFSDGNTIERNTTNDNCDGLVVEGSGNTIARNTAEGNLFGIVVDGDANTVEGNTTSKNFDDGLLVLGEGNLIDRNLGRQNGFNGLAVDAIGNTVSRNTFDNNVEFGICVIAGNTDGGGNRAKGNGAGQIDFDCLVP